METSHQTKKYNNHSCVWNSQEISNSGALVVSFVFHIREFHVTETKKKKKKKKNRKKEKKQSLTNTDEERREENRRESSWGRKHPAAGG